ncbi:arylformamidase [Pseudalkalibacillus berkeleyi]|uniref:Kynurenine formamidase n=1 Tax=Pseudalkalibacillus berkeleyi TaxID=1069813 RepID=A0ABS9H1J8_9BACL|nr:arylformamidase [Pseudalkalibacillus berkeleyi]MCF6138868.1 arylformamidase [Pseudalkalibacillus berkeleyi]
MKIWDISQPLKDGVPTWPGDTPFTFKLNWTKEETGSVNVGNLSLSTHTGTHVDAPYHFDDDGKRMLDLQPELYVGDALVVHLENRESITPDDLKGYDLSNVERLLIKTSSWKDRSQFPESITYLSPELAPFLKENGIRLIGVDVPSVDQLDSKDLASHHSLLNHDIHILESVILDEVEEGVYELIALPLPLADSDASPVRAILRR